MRPTHIREFIMRKLFTLLLAVATSVGTMRASDTRVDGIWYDFDSSTKTASVTYRGNYYDSYDNDYSGSVVIPASVTYLAVKYSVTSIGDEAFYDCRGLTSVTIPNSVTSIGDLAFSYCTGLTSVTIGNSVTSIGDEAFSDCTGLTSVTIGNSVTSIGEWAFAYCSGLTSVTIPNSVTSIGNNAFKGCSSLTSVTIPNSVTSIGNSAFDDCTGLTSVTIGNSVTSIGNSAFAYCTGLTSVTIPNSVTSIGDRAFAYCSGLTSVYNFSPAPQVLESNVFTGVDISNCILYVPQESINFYKVALVWRDFKNILPVESSDQAIDNTPFPSGEGRGEASKILRDGQVFIFRGDKTYTLQGQEVK